MFTTATAAAAAAAAAQKLDLPSTVLAAGGCVYDLLTA